MKKLLFGLLLTGALFTTACGSDAKKANGEACTAASECESNHCDATSKQCAAAPLVKKGDGEACAASSECQSNNCDMSATPHVCAAAKKADGAQCAASSECQSNNCDTSATPHVCAAAKKGDGEACAASSECQSNNCDTSVTPHVCNTVKKANGAQCAASSECQSNNCDTSVTPHVCKTAPGSVNAGGFCDETKDCATVPGGPTPACIDAEPGKKRCSAICTGAGQCPSPYYVCVPAKEESTKDVLACSRKPGKGSVEDGQPCSLESDADQECKTSGHVCDPVTHTCQAAASTKKADGAQCAAPTECQSNNCDMSATPHVCGAAKKADGAQCAAPAECQSNNCDTSVTPHVCKTAKKGGGEVCSKDDECKSNSCDMSSHTCKAGPTEPCSATIACADMGTQQGVCLSTPIGDKCSLTCSVNSDCAAVHAPLTLNCKDVTPVGGSTPTKACTL